MGSALSGESHVVQSGDAEHGLVNTVALESAAAQDFPVLQPGQRVFHSGPGPAMDCVLRLLLSPGVRLTTSFAVRDDQTGALVAVVGDGGCAAAGTVDAGLAEFPAVVSAAGQRQPDRRGQAAVGIDDDLQVRRVPVVLAGGGHAAVAGGQQGAVDDEDVSLRDRWAGEIASRGARWSRMRSAADFETPTTAPPAAM